MMNLRILESSYLVKSIETDRSQKRRRQKRWAKPRFRTEPDLTIYQTPEGIICHPSIAHEIRRQLAAAQL